MVSKILTETVMATPLPAAYSALRGQRILVTGAEGFMGGDLLRRLHEYGLDVTGSVEFERDASALEGHGYQAMVLDLTDPGDWSDRLKGFDLVFSVAALFQGGEHSEARFFEVNVDGTLKLAKTAQQVGVKRFVHCGTVGVYGHVKEIPCTEQSPFNPMDEYHRSKLEGELKVLEFAKSQASHHDHEMVVTVNRAAMVYGPGDERLRKLFTTIRNRRFIMIGSGNTLAHLNHIDDQTDSLLLCAVAPKEKVHLQAFNIASGNYITLNELVESVASALGVKLLPFKLPLAPVWLASLICEKICQALHIKPPLYRRRVGFFTHNRAFDYSKAEQLIGYESKVEHKSGIENTAQWYRRHKLL